jgi:hypothetical protein
VVQTWQTAVNEQDAPRVLGLSDPEIEIVGPRGSGFGHDLLQQWLQHARVQLEPRRTFSRGDYVVVEQRGTWRTPEMGELVGEADIASVFRVLEGRVTYYARFGDLTEALEHARSANQIRCCDVPAAQPADAGDGGPGVAAPRE